MRLAGGAGVNVGELTFYACTLGGVEPHVDGAMHKERADFEQNVRTPKNLQAPPQGAL